jgi:hypothetical protein
MKKDENPKVKDGDHNDHCQDFSNTSSMKKEEEAMRVSIDNMMRQKDLSEVKAKTDDDIMDEEAGRARIRLAEASALRREEEENALKIAEANRREKLKETKVKTDDDIMDEAAGKARLELAAKSAARRAESAEALRQQNKALAEKLRLAKAATDTSIDDEAAGTMRREYAEAARARLSRSPIGCSTCGAHPLPPLKRGKKERWFLPPFTEEVAAQPSGCCRRRGPAP